MLAPPRSPRRISGSFGGTLVEPSWNLASGPPRTTPEPIWAETPKLSAVGERKRNPTRQTGLGLTTTSLVAIAELRAWTAGSSGRRAGRRFDQGTGPGEQQSAVHALPQRLGEAFRFVSRIYRLIPHSLEPLFFSISRRFPGFTGVF